jgi:hypothetical protein
MMSDDFGEPEDSVNAEIRARLGPQAAGNAALVLTYAPDGVVLWASDHLLKRLGYTRFEFDRGMIDWDRTTPPEYWTVDDACIGNLTLDFSAPPYVKELVRKDGERIAVRVHVIRSAHHGTHLIALMTELTEHAE